MKGKQIGANCYELSAGPGGLSVLLSYGVPVACHVPGFGYYRTDTHYSTTTSRHINAWMGPARPDGKYRFEVEQGLLDGLALNYPTFDQIIRAGKAVKA